MSITKALSKPILTPPLFDEFFKPWNEWFDSTDFPSRMLTMPAVNVTENSNHYTVSLAVPGMKKEDFRIAIEGNMLSITSEKEEKKEEGDEKYTRREYSYSSFSRSFNLPDDVRQDGIEAKYEEGVLNIRLPRKEEAKKLAGSKMIPVK